MSSQITRRRLSDAHCLFCFWQELTRCTPAAATAAASTTALSPLSHSHLLSLPLSPLCFLSALLSIFSSCTITLSSSISLLGGSKKKKEWIYNFLFFKTKRNRFNQLASQIRNSQSDIFFVSVSLLFVIIFFPLMARLVLCDLTET